jgi:adenylate kinase family enzyme
MKKKLHIFFLVGACGTGKSTLVSHLKKKHNKEGGWEFLLFSDIGLPSKEEKIKKYGSQKAWQKETIKIWINKILTEYSDKEVIIFEGQVNLDFIKESFAKHDFSNYTIILFDCSKKSMFNRLIEKRFQSELATPEMNHWRETLLEQARSHKEYIINTDNLNEEQTVKAFEKIFKESIVK